MKEQIEEIAQDFCGNCSRGVCILDGKKCDLKCTNREVAEKIYNAGYRKQSEDTVEVVRCKDCKYFFEGKIADETTYFCDKSVGMIDVAPDCYCSYGERE